MENHGDQVAPDTVHFVFGHFGYVENLALGFVLRYAELVCFNHRLTLFVKNLISVFIQLVNGNLVAFFVVRIIRSFKTNGAGNYLSLRRLNKLHERKRSHALAAARFADNADDFPFGYIEGNAVNRLDHTHVRKEVGVKVIKLNDILRVLHYCEILAFGHVFSAFFLFKLQSDFEVLFGYAAGFLGGNVMLADFLVLFEQLTYPVPGLFEEVFFLLSLFARLFYLFLRGLSYFQIIFIFLFIHNRYLFIFGSKASRKPSPTKLKPSTASMIQIPGGIH